MRSRMTFLYVGRYQHQKFRLCWLFLLELLADTTIQHTYVRAIMRCAFIIRHILRRKESMQHYAILCDL